MQESPDENQRRQHVETLKSQVEGYSEDDVCCQQQVQCQQQRASKSLPEIPLGGVPLSGSQQSHEKISHGQHRANEQHDHGNRLESHNSYYRRIPSSDPPRSAG